MISCTLGIDTSCYTTSLALASEGKIVASRRRLLTVEEGERGLQQSKGVFQHVNRLPELFEALLSEAEDASTPHLPGPHPRLPVPSREGPRARSYIHSLGPAR